MLALLAMMACDRSGYDFVPHPVDGYDGVAVLGELTPVESADLRGPSARRAAVTYATVTVPRDTLFGGATATFVADGSLYCVIVDPEAVTWNQAVDLDDPASDYVLADNTDDDGDVDLSAGLSSNYTGTPGLIMGNFEQAYQDSLGTQVTVNTNECQFVGSRGQVGAHAGRSTPEYCEVDTVLHPGREYTIALDTWSVPMDDDLLSYGLMVVVGGCGAVLEDADVGNWECVIPGESCTPEEDEAGNCNDREAGFAAMELAYCASAQEVYCGCSLNASADNPDCNGCADDTTEFSYADGELTVTTYADFCGGEVLESYTGSVSSAPHCR